MCGICGVVLDGRKRTQAEWADIKLTIARALVATQSRGMDATGLFTVSTANGVNYEKQSGPAHEFITSEAFWDSLADLDENTVAIVGHCRLATHGSCTVDANNHPLVDGNIVGVHNGVLANHADLGRRYKSLAEVDSASAMAAIRAKSPDGITNQTMRASLQEMRGTFALVVADSRATDGIWVARNTYSPLVFSRDAKRGLFWLASTQAILQSAVGATNSFALPHDHFGFVTGKAASTHVAWERTYEHNDRPRDPIRELSDLRLRKFDTADIPDGSQTYHLWDYQDRDMPPSVSWKPSRQSRFQFREERE